MGIRLKELLLKEISAECRELFGDKLFGEFKAIYGKVIEKDTKFESEAIDMIIKWVDAAGGRQMFLEYLKALMKCRDSYPDILKPPAGVYYRAFHVKDSHPLYKEILEEEIEIVHINTRDEYWNNPKMYRSWFDRISFDYTYTPYHKIESWTPSKSSVLRFAKQSKNVNASMAALRRPPRLGFVVQMHIPEDELLFTSSFMDLIGIHTGWGKQREVLRVATSKTPVTLKHFYLAKIVNSKGNLVNGFNIPKHMKDQAYAAGKSAWQSF